MIKWHNLRIMFCKIVMLRAAGAKILQQRRGPTLRRKVGRRGPFSGIPGIWGMSTKRPLGNLPLRRKPSRSAADLQELLTKWPLGNVPLPCQNTRKWTPKTRSKPLPNKHFATSEIPIRETLQTLAFMETFEAFPEKGQNHPEKHQVFQSNPLRFRDIRGSHFPNGKTAICDIEKCVQKPI